MLTKICIHVLIGRRLLDESIASCIWSGWGRWPLMISVLKRIKSRFTRVLLIEKKGLIYLTWWRH